MPLYDSGQANHRLASILNSALYVAFLPRGIASPSYCTAFHYLIQTAVCIEFSIDNDDQVSAQDRALRDSKLYSSMDLDSYIVKHIKTERFALMYYVGF
jgi:hypothetical protein